MLKIPINVLLKIPKVLSVVFLLLLFMNIFVIVFSNLTGHYHILGLYPAFNFEKEYNIPTNFSTFNLLLSSVLLYLIYHVHKTNRLYDSKYWLLLSLIFLYLSLDESIAIHELLGTPIKELLGITGSLFNHAWVIPGIIICILLFAYFFKFYWGLLYRYKVMFGISAFLYFSGVIMIEAISGIFNTSGYHQPTLIYSLLMTIEESLEMIGIIFFIYSLLDYIKSEIQTTDYTLS